MKCSTVLVTFSLFVVLDAKASFVENELEQNLSSKTRNGDQKNVLEWIPDKSGQMHLVDVDYQQQRVAFDPFQDVKLFLYTRNETKREIFFYQDLSKASFHKNDLTIFLIHGWQDDGGRLPMIIDAFLRRESYNCILVNWSKGSKTIDYIAARNRIYEVAKFVASFIEFHHSSGEMAPLVQIVGHSLGAHAAGAVGKYLRPFKISKIFGLDPAGPLFRTVSAEKRLDKGDADLVTVLHTSQVLGLVKSVGHHDFFLNFGHDQLNCGSNVKCSHSIVVDYFAESINSKGFVAVSCSAFFMEHCQDPSKESYIMSPYADKLNKPTSFLVKTNSKAPFATFKRPV